MAVATFHRATPAMASQLSLDPTWQPRCKQQDRERSKDAEGGRRESSSPGPTAKTTYLTLKQTTLHPSPFTRLAPPNQRRQDPRLRIVPREDVGHRHADFYGPAVALACNVHEARFGLDDDVVPWVLGVGACAAVACPWS